MDSSHAMGDTDSCAGLWSNFVVLHSSAEGRYRFVRRETVIHNLEYRNSFPCLWNYVNASLWNFNAWPWLFSQLRARSMMEREKGEEKADLAWGQSLRSLVVGQCRTFVCASVNAWQARAGVQGMWKYDCKIIIFCVYTYTRGLKLLHILILENYHAVLKMQIPV